MKIINKNARTSFSCDSMGIDYLEYAKKTYGYSSEKWDTMVDIETELVNICKIDPSKKEALQEYLNSKTN